MADEPDIAGGRHNTAESGSRDACSRCGKVEGRNRRRELGVGQNRTVFCAACHALVFLEGVDHDRWPQLFG